MTAFRKFAVFIPLALVLSGTMGADGVMLAEPVFDVAPVAFCAALFLATVPKALRDRQFRLHRDDLARAA